MGQIGWVVFSAILGGFVFRLIYERADEIAIWIVKTQCKLLPEEEQIEHECEWLSTIMDVNGGAWKILNALGFASSVIPYARRRANIAVRQAYALRANKIGTQIKTKALTRALIKYNIIIVFVALIGGMAYGALVVINELYDILDSPFK